MTRERETNERKITIGDVVEIIAEGRQGMITNFDYDKKSNKIYQIDDGKFWYTEDELRLPSKIDNVNHPKHYTSHPSGIECIEITRHYCFAIGNAIKYLWRAGLKRENGMEDNAKEIEDLEKAVWYIQDRIKQLKAIKS